MSQSIIYYNESTYLPMQASITNTKLAGSISKHYNSSEHFGSLHERSSNSYRSYVSYD